MTLVIRDAHLVDGTGRAPRDRAVVVIEGGRIGAVGAEGEVVVPADATVVNAGGRTVLPALMDVHASFAIRLAPSEPHPYNWNQKNIAASMLRSVAACREYLKVGATTLRVDAAAHHGIFALKEAFATGVLEGPRLVVPGRAIAMTGGHAWDSGCREADGADGVRKAAREELKAGADWVKLMATGGAGSDNERVDDVQMTVEEIRAAVEEAHKKGKYVFAHVSCAQGARNCIEAGVDSVEHGLFLEEDLVRDMVAKGIFLVPTMGVYRRLVDMYPAGLVPEFKYRKALQVLGRYEVSLRRALEAGVKIAIGTDAGSAYHPAGESLLYEMEILNRQGMSPMEVLIAATRRAAECLHMAEDLGTLEAGKLADVLIVEGDPLANISALRNSWLVLKEGQPVFQRNQP